ncbi:MAG: arsenate reductase [Piscirickettsiaceae bacterium CG_4_9_14_3_um_filter_43_564]|nr:Spx/MgsR family RNA polymerase-binding regulatory protein [Thiomicrospira sp.]OIP94288.1 MAG: arsenate reductase [Thiomicrospira sp. CG2_30_44_34]PIQ02804.1 MAG: arsenate reductase [Piscirickettsiaceae bacterium CG18_big_fil_WC_8_21_14_2_50_44_103]PIU38618.1 MAG: arsenate reductase [Piscirickettsiaceae bacterium CG07_land_8_20_14_0_80_44_28]PIW58474.1 MAG: arsenate reductase [Piscirickettsiaceae bacterium CG12_big_fil_rev_8_21_14_0_65_44_934]PIW78764.1 MAG: arsenate reductase [Pisciricketts
MILYGIPNCDTVRKARKFLESHQIDFQFQDFRKRPLTIDTLQAWLKHHPMSVIVNKRSTAWKQLDEPQQTALMNSQQPALLIENPTLIKRPVLQTAQQVLFGFNTKEYEKLL